MRPYYAASPPLIRLYVQNAHLGAMKDITIPKELTQFPLVIQYFNLTPLI